MCVQRWGNSAIPGARRSHVKRFWQAFTSYQPFPGARMPVRTRRRLAPTHAALRYRLHSWRAFASSERHSHARTSLPAPIIRNPVRARGLREPEQPARADGAKSRARAGPALTQRRKGANLLRLCVRAGLAWRLMTCAALRRSAWWVKSQAPASEARAGGLDRAMPDDCLNNHYGRAGVRWISSRDLRGVAITHSSAHILSGVQYPINRAWSNVFHL